MSDDPEKPSAEAPAGRVIRAVRRRRMPESLSATVQLDRRTRASKAIEAFRADLVRHLGGRPSAVQSALVEQAIQLRLRIYAMDAAFVERGEQSAHDTRTYLAWSNSLQRLLRQLGLKGAAERPPNLSEYLAGRDKAPGAGQDGTVSTPRRTAGSADPLAVPSTASVKVPG